MKANSSTGIPSLMAVAKAAGIIKVYWIDDQFSIAGSQLVTKIREKVDGLAASGVKPKHPSLADVVFTEIQSENEKIIATVLSTRAGLGHELLQSLDDQIDELDPQPTRFTDLTHEQIELIASSLGPVERLSFADWKAKKTSLLEASNEGVLFLIDHDFSLEEGCTNIQGQDILHPLITDAKQRCLCILFTHGGRMGNEHEEREAIAKEMAVVDQRHRFSVVCKGQIRVPMEGGEAPIAHAFQDAFVREWCHMMIESTQRLMVEAFKATKDDLLSLTFDQVSNAFFKRAVADGTREFDVLVRVMMLAGRVAIEDAAEGNKELWDRLAKVRAIMGVSSSPDSGPRLTGRLQKLREREIWEPATYINALYSPPSCGDVFETDKKKQYVLVGQPCQLAIRGDGSRDNSEALFLEVTDREPDAGKGYWFEFPFGGKWVNFVKVFPVNLYLLDVVSFNNVGSLRISRDDFPSPLMLPGVKSHFDKVISYLRSYDPKRPVSFRYQRLTINENLSKGDTRIENGVLKLPFRRVGRIRAPHAEAILAGLAVCHTRMAFDYDFSKDIQRSPDPSTVRPPADSI